MLVDCAPGVCCEGDDVIIYATYTGECDTTSFIQVDLNTSDDICTLRDDWRNNPGVPGCDDTASIDGVSAQVTCGGAVCSGIYTIPDGGGGAGAVPGDLLPNDCYRKTAIPFMALIYENNFKCDDGTSMSNTTSIVGNITLASRIYCQLINAGPDAAGGAGLSPGDLPAGFMN